MSLSEDYNFFFTDISIVTLTNIQVVLQGIEQSGYVVASSHVATIFGCDHKPKMKNRVFVSKTSWVGRVQELQVTSNVT